ncbi:MAG: purine-binding chemotaxis protein CheW [Rhodocyclaceae bacterium]|nr:purine-binding chemotaxis protein CheW [Rhodocyclaceae bacterium]
MGQVATTPVKAGVPATAAAADNAPQQYLTFTLGGEMFAVAILNVKEIIEYGTVTEIPMMPPFIRGVINLRGAVVPVIDLSCRFGGKTTQVARRTCIVIIELNEGDAKHDIGVMVDAVSEVLEIAPSEIEPAPAFGAKIRTDFISGMGKVNGKFVIILSIDRVLSVEEIALLSQVGEGAAGETH